MLILTATGQPLLHGLDVRIDDVDYSFASLVRMAETGTLPEGVEDVAPPPPPLAERVATVCAAIDAERDRRLALDFAYDFGATPAVDDQGIEIEAGVRALQMAPANRADWQTVHGLALAAIISGSPTAVMPIRCEDNWNVQTTALEIVACLTAATLRGSALVFYGGALKTAARASADPEAIDILTGWPS